MPIVGESMTLWLVAALALAMANLALAVGGIEIVELGRALLLMGLCAALTAAGLVSARSTRLAQATLREERARPASEELGRGNDRAAPYARGMARWAEAMVELLDHGSAIAEAGSSVHTELTGAATEARDLRELFDVEADELSLNDQARLHALGSLWETGQPRLEQLVAELDPHWHRCWRARHVDARLLRHGHDLPRPLVLPYRP